MRARPSAGCIKTACASDKATQLLPAAHNMSTNTNAKFADVDSVAGTACVTEDRHLERNGTKTLHTWAAQQRMLHRERGSVILSKILQPAETRSHKPSLLPGRRPGCACPRSITLLSATLLRSGRTTSRSSSSSSVLFDVDASGASSPATAAGLSCSLCSGGAQPGSGAQAAPGAQQVYARWSTTPSRQAQQRKSRLAASQQEPGRCRSSNNSCTAAAQAGRSTGPMLGRGQGKAL